MRMGRWLAIGLGVVALLAGAGAASAASHLIRITSTLEPATITIAPGDTITWRNDDGTRHRMRTTSGPGEFDSGDLDPGASYSVTLTAVGTYAYRDERDRELSNYWGTIVVATNPATPSPGTSSAPGPTPPPGGATIRMAGRAFSPGSISIPAGTSVTWINDDDRDHTVTSNSNAFDSGLLPPGASFVRTFSTAGSFAFVCLIHPDMTGVVNVSGPGGGTPPPPTPAPPPTPTPAPVTGDVVIVDFAFTPADLTIDTGTRVTFANRGAALHTVTATDGTFDSGLIAPNATFQRVFADAGTFPFLCALHPSMTGTVRVRGPNGATPPPAATPAPAATTPPGGVRIVDFAYTPSQLRVRAGASVTWINGGIAPHTVTARDGSFASTTLAPGAAYTRTFATPGTFAYLCAIHPDMTGTVLVEDAAGVVPPPEPTTAPQPPPAPPPGTTDVRIVDLAFDPSTVTVTAGSTVRFTNQGVAIHTATALDGSFDSGFLASGDAWERTFDAPGAYAFVCALHPSMVGTVVVTAAGAPAGPAGPPTGPPGAASGGGDGGPVTGGESIDGGSPGRAAEPIAGDGASGRPPSLPALLLVLGLGAAAVGSYLGLLRGIVRRAEG